MEELEKNYKQIAESINELIPCDWDKVWMYGEILDDSAEIVFYFKEQNGNEYVNGHQIPHKYSVNKSTYIHLVKFLKH